MRDQGGLRMETATTKKKRKPPAGISSNALVHTAMNGTNDLLFPQILSLYGEYYLPEEVKWLEEAIMITESWREIDHFK